MGYVITAGFMAMDILTGIIQALKEKNFNSSIMREGLFHKCGSVICIIFGIMVDYAQNFFDLGTNLPIAGAICTYIILMEIASIIENVCKINPEIVPDKLMSYFSKLTGGGKDEN